MSVPYLEIGSLGFWSKASASFKVYQDGSLLYAVLDSTAKMTVILRTAEELFQTTVRRESVRRSLSLIINGNFYDLTPGGKWDALRGSDPVPAAATTPIGLLIRDYRRIGGRNAQLLFYLAHYHLQCPEYQFGFGDPPVSSKAAIGGAGPMILGGLKYGYGNVYQSGTPQNAPATGDPGQYRGNLLQRNNNTYASAANRSPLTGKTLVGLNTPESKLIVVVQKHGATPGISMDEVRDKLHGAGVDNAIFLDGSDSSMFFANGVFHASQGANKDETNTIGVGFSV